MQLVIGLLAICCTLASVVTSDHHYYRNREVILHNRPIVTQLDPHFQDDRRYLAHVNKFADHIKHQYLVHIQGPVQTEMKNKIEEVIGQKLGVYVPHNTFLLYATQDVASKAISAPGVLWVGAVHPEDKYPAKMTGLVSSNDPTMDPKTMIISLVPEERTIAQTSFIAKRWASNFPYKFDLQMITADSKDKIVLKLKTTSHFLKILQWVAERPESHWIEPGLIHTSHNQYVTRVLQSNNAGVSTTPFTDLGINGTGQLIGLADSGLAYTSCYFSEAITIQPNTLYLTNRKLVKYVTRFGDFLDADGHGTHVAGTIAGENAQNDTTQNGVASAAKIHFTDISTQAGVLSPPTDVSELFAEAYSDGARIYVASFGSTNSSWYTTNARDIDAYVAANPLLLVVVSAGNEGTGKSLSSLGVSKNALVVGASQSDPLGLGFPATPVISGTHTLANFSSIGPTPDGRIKPDVVAPAQSITSASTGTCGTTLRFGTSYAAGAAGAAAAIVKTWLTKGYYPSGVIGDFGFRDPSTQVASLIKAMLINSGQSLQYYDAGNGNFLPLAKSFPGPQQGFGRLQLDKTLVLDGRSSTPSPLMIAVVNTIAESGGSYRFCFTANSSTPYVKVTLVWTDPAGSLSSGLALVNNLDLVVVESSGVTHYTDTSDEKFDSVNNVEQIILRPTTSTNFAVHVHGYNVPIANQQFSVVVSGAESSLLCQLEFDPGQRVCPNQCSGRGTCTNDGFCQCNTGYKGADCSITPCPNDCSGNGVCDFETSSCVCQNNYAPPSCAQVRPPPSPPQSPPPETVGIPASEDGIDTGVFAGVVVAAFFVGAICSVVIGGFLAVKYLEHKRDQAHKEADSRGNADL